MSSGGWWSRPIVPKSNERRATCKEAVLGVLPGLGAVFTILLIFLTLFLIDKAHYHAQVSIQSIAVDSSATWHVDFVVKNPSSRYSIYYDGDGVAVKLDSLNAAVLNISHIITYRDLSVFSLVFVVEGNRNEVVYEQLDIKLRAKHKNYLDYNEAGHFDITCQILMTRSPDNINKFKCKSSFSHQKLLIDPKP